MMKVNKNKYLLFAVLLAFCTGLNSQSYYWQQEANYTMEIDFDAKKHQFEGEQTITYTNNSPDTLNKLYYYLFFNAFQPNSMMDVRSRTIVDPDRRVGNRIAQLSDDEIGYQKVKRLKVDGKKQKFFAEGTILEVQLKKHILPGQTVKIELEFDAQVPVQIRRAGRNNKEGIDYSMAQWFPKLCEYDKFGWHAVPYVGREFHGIWGDYDVTIEIDSDYILAATGELQNANEIGYGYGNDPTTRPKKHKWHFKAKNVIDFMWAADPDYNHISKEAYDGTMMRFFYQPGEKTNENWERLPAIMDEALRFINENFGQYQYPVYNFIQGGDGGMEYPMGTLITGHRSLSSLVGVSIHEWMHSWYQMMLATNEALYPWMDEGFTSYASAKVMNHLKMKKFIPGDPVENPHLRSVAGFANFALSGVEEPLSTPSDHYNTNAAYGTASYTKGSLTLVQLGYILGEETMRKGLLRYFNEWKFKHPTPDDFFRVMEKESGAELDWFKHYWVNTTATMDYGIDTLIGDKLTISKIGEFPMPLDIVVTTKKGKKHMYHIPLSLMRNDKPREGDYKKYKTSKDWNWTHPSYTIQLKVKKKDIQSIEIDPSGRMIDVDRTNNIWNKSERP
jgi:hypothetical protein